MTEQEKKVLAAAGRNDLLEAWATLDAEHSEVLRKKNALREQAQKVFDAAAVDARHAELRACGYVLLERDVWVRLSPHDPKYADVRHEGRVFSANRHYEVRISDGRKKGTSSDRDAIDPEKLRWALRVTT